jgi:hypothetical protein
VDGPPNPLDGIDLNDDFNPPRHEFAHVIVRHDIPYSVARQTQVHVVDVDGFPTKISGVHTIACPDGGSSAFDL